LIFFPKRSYEMKKKNWILIWIRFSQICNICFVFVENSKIMQVLIIIRTCMIYLGITVEQKWNCKNYFLFTRSNVLATRRQSYYKKCTTFERLNEWNEWGIEKTSGQKYQIGYICCPCCLNGRGYSQIYSC